MVRVLRLGPGDRVSAFDGTGREVVASLVTATVRRTTARILDELSRPSPSRLRLTLAQVVPRGGAMDLVVAKATELGVSRIIPLETWRSVRRAGRASRWLRIAQEAAEQCGRRDLPELTAASSLEAFLLQHPRDTPLLACDAGPDSRPLPTVCRELEGASALTLLVGSEGGLDRDEVRRLRSHGALLTGLGPRLLRADTAALAALAVIQASLGDWGAAPAGEGR